MTTLPLHHSSPRRPAIPAVEHRHLIDRLEAFFIREARRGKVPLRLMALGTVVTAAFAALGYAIFGEGNQHQFFRDIGPVTALSELMILSVGFIGLLIARRQHPTGNARWLNFWFLAGAGFFLLTIDAPLDLHGRLGKLIATQTTIAEDIGFNATSDAILFVYLLTGLVISAVYWRELLRHPLVVMNLAIGGALVVTSMGIDSFAAHSSWMWVLEEWVELLGLAWIVGAFCIRLNRVPAAVKQPNRRPAEAAIAA